MAKKKAKRKAKKASRKKTVKKKAKKAASKGKRKAKRKAKKPAKKAESRKPKPRKVKFKKIRITKTQRRPIKITEHKRLVIKVKQREPTTPQPLVVRELPAKAILLKIQRYVPEKDIKPFYTEYTYYMQNNETLMDALNHIKWNEDESLSFRRGCRMGICGTCAMRVNGHAVLGCNTTIRKLVDDFNTNTLTIEPLKNFPVIRDLIVDLDPFWEDMKRVKAWLVPKETKKVLPSQLDRIKSAGDCVACGACMSDCSVVREDPNFVGPAALLKSYRFANDPRDSKLMDRLYHCNRKGIWKCTEMFSCVEQCPKDIDIFKAIAELRAEIIRCGLTSSGVRYTKSFVKSVKGSGKVDEVRLVLAANPLQAVTGMRPALRMLHHDKRPSFNPKKIPNHERFMQTCAEAEDEEKRSKDK